MSIIDGKMDISLFNYTETLEAVCDDLKTKNGTKEMTWYIAPYGNKFKKMREELHMRKCIWQAGFRGKVRKI